MAPNDADGIPSGTLPRVFVVGASLTIHFHPYLQRELAGRFIYDRKMPADGKSPAENMAGASGGDSGMVLAHLRHRRMHDPIAADLLLLSCGLHDLRTDAKTGAKQVGPEQFAQNLHEIVREVAAMNLALGWLRITPVVDEIHNARCTSFHRYSADVDRYNAIADPIMGDAGARIIDFHAFCQKLLPHCLIDHVHYNDDARQQQAVFIAKELAEWAKSRQSHSRG